MQLQWLIPLFTWPQSVEEGAGQQKSKVHVYLFLYFLQKSDFSPLLPYLFICCTVPSQTLFRKVESNLIPLDSLLLLVTRSRFLVLLTHTSHCRVLACALPGLSLFTRCGRLTHMDSSELYLKFLGCFSFFIIVGSPLRIPLFISTFHFVLEEDEHKMDCFYYTEGNMNLESELRSSWRL